MTATPLPDLNRPLPSIEGRLRVEGDAAPQTPLHLTGRLADARGDAVHGLRRLRFHDGAGIDGVRLETARGLRYAVSPLGWERRCEAGGEPLLERIVLAYDLPFAVMEWIAPAGASLILRCRFRLPGADPRWHADGRMIRVVSEEDGRGVLLLMNREPDRWDPPGDPDTGPARLGIRLGPGEALRVAIVSAPANEAALARLLPALGDPEATTAARGAALARLRAEGFRIDVPDPRVGPAVDWAKARLDACMAPDAGSAGWHALAALAAGCLQAATQLIASVDGEPAARLGRLAIEAWTGARPADARRTGVVRSVTEALDLAADAVRSAPGGQAWAAFAGGRVEAGAEHWRQMLDAGLPAVVPDAEAAAGTILALVHGLLGAVPDAPLNRVRLRPRIPAGWNRLEAAGLRIGEASLALHYRRDGTRHIFALRQDAGPVPLQVVLEPAIPARGLATALVDGRPAELDPRAFGDRLLVPVQLVTDHERTLELHAREDPGAG